MNMEPPHYPRCRLPANSLKKAGQNQRIKNGLRQKSDQLISFKRRRVKTFYKNLIITSAFLAALSADAIGPVVTDLSLNVSPQYPSAGENFTVKAKSFTFDPVRANFQWLLNGKIVSSGKGLSEQIFTASKLGSQMTIKAVATMNGGSSFGAQIIVNVADIDLIASPLTYTPLFYRGYSFASPGAVVEIYAVPHLFSGGARIAPKNLIYEWFVDGNKFSAKSGEGKNKFILDTWDAGNASYDIGLKVSSSGGSISVKKIYVYGRKIRK